MKITQTQQNNDDVMFVMIAVVYTLSILFFQFTLEILKWLFNPNKSLLPLRSVTSQSESKKAVSNSQSTQTSKMPRKAASPARATSDVASKECSVASGSQQGVTTAPKNLKTSPDGMMSRPLRTSKNGPLTQPVRRQRATTSSPTTQTPGLGFSV